MRDDRPVVLLVEDDVRLTRLVREYLEHEGFVVAVEHDGSRAVDRILAEPPDVVVLDQMLPGEDGRSVLRRIRPTYEGPVLMLTARTDEVDQILGLELGADDYLGKPASPRLLLARIRALLRRNQRSDEPARLVDGDLVVDLGRREVLVGGQPVELTTSEFDLLQVLVRHVGRPVSRETLVSALRGISYDGIDRSIDMRVSQLRRKLRRDEHGVDRIKTVRGVGYQLVLGS